MPSFVLVDASIFVNAVDLSDQCEGCTVTFTKDIKDATTMGLLGRRRKSGLYDWTIRLDFFQNYDLAKVSATLDPLLGVETALRVRASKTLPISTTNPEYQGNGMYGETTVVAGSVGEMAKTSITFMGSDGVPLIRDVTP